MVPNIVKIYNKSDFTIQVPLADGYDNQEFRFTIYTCGEIENGWVASYINGNYTNCSVTEDIVTIFVDNNNNINPGCVTVQAEYDFSNHHFLDDEDNIKDNFKTNVYLVSYETNSFSAMYRPSVLPDLSETTDFVTWPEIEEELAYYVTFTYLNTYNYITEEYLDNTLENYITEEQLGEYGFLTHSDLDNMSYATESYVTSKLAGKQDMLINGINIKSVNGYSLVGSGNVEITFPEVDLSGYVTYSSLQTYLGSYVTKYDLSQAGYLTSNDISSFITSDDVYDILAESSYVTSRTLSEMGYVTNQVLEQTLSDASYLTQNDISNMSYVTQSELNNASYATTSYVENYVATYGGNVDLSGYVSKEELNQAGYITMGDVSACGYITSIPSEYVTESELYSMSYATTTYVENYVATYGGNVDLSAYVTKDELNQAGYITSIPSEYITESELDSMSYATTTYVENYVNTHSGPIDLSAYVTKDELNQAGYLTSIPSDYATYDAISQMGYITSIPSEYITESELEGMSYATTTYVADYVNTHSGPIDLSAYVTKDELNQAGYISSIPSEYITESELSGMSYVTQSELNNASYATTTYVEQYVTTYGGSNIQEVTQAEYDAMAQAGTLDPDTIYIITDATGVDMSYYVTYSYMIDYINTYAPTPDLSAYVTKTELNNAGYLTSIPSNYATYDAISQMGYITSIPSEYITETELSSMGYITSIPSEYVTESELNSMSYATQTYVVDYVSQHAPTPDLSAYVTKTELNNAGYLTSIPSNYATYEAIANMGYVTSSDLPDLTSYVTYTYLDSQNYATESYVSANVKDFTYYSPNNFLTFTAVTSSSSVTLNLAGSLTQVFYYSLDKGATWNEYTIGTQISLAMNASVMFRSVGNFSTGYFNYYYFSMTGKIVASGDVSSLMNGKGGYITLEANQQFRYLFSGCTSLIKAPNLMCINPNGNAFNGMFSGCTGLTETPDFPAGFGSNYENMFNGCTNLKYVKNLAKHATGGTISISNWMNNVSSTGVFVKLKGQEWTSGANGIPTGWTIYEYDSPETVYLGDYATTSYVENYVTKTELDSMSYITQNQLSSNSYINQQYLDNVGYTTAYVLTQDQYDGLSYSDKNKETIYIISDQNTYMNNELVTESSLDSRGFLTAANFSFDATTGTLTLNI